MRKESVVGVGPTRVPYDKCVILKWSPRLYNNKVCTMIHGPLNM